jgi:hypothetical protein
MHDPRGWGEIQPLYQVPLTGGFAIVKQRHDVRARSQRHWLQYYPPCSGSNIYLTLQSLPNKSIRTRSIHEISEHTGSSYHHQPNKHSDSENDNMAQDYCKRGLEIIKMDLSMPQSPLPIDSTRTRRLRGEYYSYRHLQAMVKVYHRVSSPSERCLHTWS